MNLPRFALSVVFVALAACTPTPPALVPQVQAGPAVGVRPNRVLVLQAACGSVEYRCPKEYGHTVDTIVRSGLEFAGFGVVDSEALRTQTRQRHEEHTTVTTGETSQSHTDVEQDLNPFDTHTTTTGQTTSQTETDFVVLDGPGFEDLSVDERHQVLAKSGADAVVSVRIVVGGQVGMWTPNQNVEVMVKLGVNQGDAMAWASRCMASSNDFSTVTAALENAARCAIHGATAR
jgi:hypothetical protein